MKTVVIIDSQAVELASLVNLFEQWQKEINILTASENRAAISIIAKHQVDLVVCDLAWPGAGSLEDLSLLTHTFPSIPCIALGGAQGSLPEDVVQRGASRCLSKPIDSHQLLQCAEELLETASSGPVKGIPIHSFLQMLETEEKTCTLEVKHRHDTGRLFIQNGALISAETGKLSGEEAALEILSWQENIIHIRFFNGQRRRQIHRPLISIIMEAFRLQEQRTRPNQNGSGMSGGQLPLRHLPTIGRRIPLENGAKLDVEFPGKEGMEECTMVGMLQEQYLIITNPRPVIEREAILGNEQRLVVKYLHKNRAWMFKTQILRAINSPSPLLFLDYPGVIHYHELRKAKRTAIFIPCTCHRQEDPGIYGALIDLSTGGALCRIKRHESTPPPTFDIDGIILLRCLLPGMKEEQKIHGRIRHLQLNDRELRIGIEFEDLQPQLADTISRYLFTIEGTGG
ncbi:MAG TPA: DUF4388 domain-containing protein [Desulforhopalus sp.]|nr:DUF4388 domain-containing protein [Desulforhopalus sp.]